MPDKNSGAGAGAGLPSGLSYVVCGEPLLKAEFLGRLAGRQGGTVYIDLDMMYGGFLRAGAAPAPPGGLVYIGAAEGEGVRRALGRAVAAVSSGGPRTVVIDTLNGMYDAAAGMPGGEARADASIMILAMAARHTSSRVVVACVAEPGRGAGEGEWYLVPGRRRLPMPAGDGGGASWLRLARGDRPEGGGEEAIALEPIARGQAGGRRMPAPRPHPAARPRQGARAPNGVIRPPNGVIISPPGASYISNPAGQRTQCQ